MPCQVRLPFFQIYVYSPGELGKKTIGWMAVRLRGVSVNLRGERLETRPIATARGLGVLLLRNPLSPWHKVLSASDADIKGPMVVDISSLQVASMRSGAHAKNAERKAGCMADKQWLIPFPLAEEHWHCHCLNQTCKLPHNNASWERARMRSLENCIHINLLLA